MKSTRTRKISGDKIYVVMSQSWEYNDEYFYTTDGDAGKTLIAYRDKAKAEAVALDKNIEALMEAGCRDGGLGEWNNCGETDFRNKGPKLDALLTKLGWDKDDRDLIIPNQIEGRDFTLTKDEAVLLMNALSLYWYYVEEVELGEA